MAVATKLCCCVPFLWSSSDEDGHAPPSPGAPHESDESPCPVSEKSVGKCIREEATHEDVNLEKLMQHISLLLELIEGNRSDKKSLTSNSWSWPKCSGLKKLKKILSPGTDLKELSELLSSGLEFVSDLKDIISGPVKELLKEIGHASLATAGLLVVASSLERFEDVSSNKEQCLKLLKEMCYVANLVKIFKENPKGYLQNLIEDATALIVEGAIICCHQIDSSPWKSFLKASKNKEDLSDMTQRLHLMYSKINVGIGIRVLTAIETLGKSSLMNRYPKDAVGIEESSAKVYDLLECESEQNAVAVILYGFGGMGKTTLADAVFSRVTGCKYSKVQLFENIDSSPDIIKLQKDILKDLMDPEETIPDIRKHEDGQQALEDRLEKVEAFIYIDNVLKSAELQQLLPKDMDNAKKVRVLITARDIEDLMYVCPTRPRTYRIKGIEPPQAMNILKKEIREGINDNEFSDILKICDGIPLMLKLVARFIARADDKGKAYNRLMQDKGKWESGRFDEMRCRFAYDAIPDKCKDPFLDICSYFKGWDWNRVSDIVGDEVLESLDSRALVSKDENGLTSVHDVIVALASERSKEVRFTLTNANQFREFLKKKHIEKTKGIWLRDIKEPLRISASELELMCNSLRVLALGNRTQVEGNCTEIFQELVFLEAGITYLPFHASKLRYLSYKPKGLKLSEMPSSLRHMRLDGRLDSEDLQISSMSLKKLGNLRTLSLLDFRELRNLPRDMGDLVKGLQEICLSGCKSIEKLPESISKLQCLRILRMVDCSSLKELPENFGSLNSLQILNLRGCSKLEAMPNSFGKLSSLTSLNLSYCKNLLNLSPSLGNLTSLTLVDLCNCKKLLNLPLGIGNLTRLVRLHLSGCHSLESIPESIKELKLLRTLCMSDCWALKELPHGFCNLASITRLSLACCRNLEKLPVQFGELASLRHLNLRYCKKLEKLPQGFGQLKYLEELFLMECYNLTELCEDFHCLSSLQILDLSDCMKLEKLPEDLHSLDSLQHLYLCNCLKLEGKWMDHVIKIKRLQVVHIEHSKQLVKRWEEIQRDGDRSWSFAVTAGQGLSMSESQLENTEQKILSEFESLLTSRRGVPFRLSDLPPNTLLLLICDLYPCPDCFPWSLIKETIDEIDIKFEIIYIGPQFDKLPEEVKARIFVGDLPRDRATDVVDRMLSTLDADVFLTLEYKDRCYFQIRTKMVGDGKTGKHHPRWRLLTDRELEELLLDNCGKYLRLKDYVETSPTSNIELLRELFAPEEDETTHVFLQNYPSQQDQTVNSQPFTCGFDKLKGKTIFLEMRDAYFCDDIHLQYLKEMYVVEKEKLDLEIISIPILKPGTEVDALDAYKQFSKDVPWLVLQTSWSVVTRAAKFFLAKQCGWKRDDEYETWYPSISWIIEPNGRISSYSPSLFPILDSGEMVKVFFNHLQSVSHQVRWRTKPCPITHEKIEELRKEEWKQQKSMSTIQFLFNHLESVTSDQVKRLMFQGKLICIYSANDEKFTRSIQSIMEELRNGIDIIHIGHKIKKKLWLTSTVYKDYYYPLKNTREVEGMSSLNLSKQEVVRFWMRLVHLKKEINEMDYSDKQLCELRSLLHSFDPNGSMTFMKEDGKMVAGCRGKIMKWMFRNDRKDRAKLLIKRMMKELEEGKETHDQENSLPDSLPKNMQTTAAAVELENMDALDMMSEYTSELLEMEQLHHLWKFDKEIKKRSQPKPITWPTSVGFHRLRNFVSDGMDMKWVQDIISGHPGKYKCRSLTNNLLREIGEADWAAAGLFVVADILERFNHVSANRDEWLLLLDEMYRTALYLKMFNQRPGSWIGMKREAAGWIVMGAIGCLAHIDPSLFASCLDEPIAEKELNSFTKDLKRKGDIMAKSITEGLGNENEALLDEMCSGWGFYESENEDEPSCHKESSGPKSATSCSQLQSERNSLFNN